MADIQSLLGDEYREGMTVEEINAVLANRQFVDPTTLPKSVEKSIFDKTASELAKVKKELGELKNSNLTGEEKVNAAIAAADALHFDNSFDGFDTAKEALLSMIRKGLSEKGKEI